MSSLDPYKVLGFPESVHIDLDRLRACYYKAQKRFHPDRRSGPSFVSPQAVTQALGNLSAQIHLAYEILENPLKRLEYWGNQWKNHLGPEWSPKTDLLAWMELQEGWQGLDQGAQKELVAREESAYQQDLEAALDLGESLLTKGLQKTPLEVFLNKLESLRYWSKILSQFKKQLSG